MLFGFLKEGAGLTELKALVTLFHSLTPCNFAFYWLLFRYLFYQYKTYVWMKNLPLLVTHLFFCTFDQTWKTELQIELTFSPTLVNFQSPTNPVGHQCQDATDEWLAVSICNSAAKSGELYRHVYPTLVRISFVSPNPIVSLPWPDVVYLYNELGKQNFWESSPLSFLRVMTGIAADSHRRCSSLSIYIFVQGQVLLIKTVQLPPKWYGLTRKKTTSDDSDLTFWSNIFCGN